MSRARTRTTDRQVFLSFLCWTAAVLFGPGTVAFVHSFVCPPWTRATGGISADRYYQLHKQPVSSFFSLSRLSSQQKTKEQSLVIPRTRTRTGTSTKRFAQDSSSFTDGGEDSHDYDTEETLLCLNLQVLPTFTLEKVLEAVQLYTNSFPFGAVLPVQPLMYLPSKDGTGVMLQFLRKKTDLKSGVDGGMRFFITSSSSSSDNNSSSSDNNHTITVSVKRYSKGQSIQKLFAEKLVVLNYVAGFTNFETAQYKGRTNYDEYGRTLPDLVHVTSIYHKWMDA